MPQSEWVTALKKAGYMKSGASFKTIPLKGTPEHEKVLSYMKSKPAVVKKAPAKKAPANKAPAKKAPAKKAPAKKAPAKNCCGQ